MDLGSYFRLVGAVLVPRVSFLRVCGYLGRSSPRESVDVTRVLRSLTRLTCTQRRLHQSFAGTFVPWKVLIFHLLNPSHSVRPSFHAAWISRCPRRDWRALSGDRRDIGGLAILFVDRTPFLVSLRPLAISSHCQFGDIGTDGIKTLSQ